MGIDVELVTLEKPDTPSIRNAYGTDIDCDVKKIRTLSLPGIVGAKNNGITINTHGDMLPFFRRSFTKNNAITYCHYPIASQLLDSGDPDYCSILQNMNLSTMPQRCRSMYH